MVKPRGNSAVTATPHQSESQKRRRKGCFACGGVGHFAKSCPTLSGAIAVAQTPAVILSGHRQKGSFAVFKTSAGSGHPARGAIRVPAQSINVNVASLRTLSDALSGFQRCFTELQQHIDSVLTSIASIKLPINTISTTTPLPASPTPVPASPDPEPEREPEPEPEPSLESDPSEEEDGEEEEEEEEMELEDEEKEEEGVNLPPPLEVKSSPSELENLCETMNKRGLRSYVSEHLSCMEGLLQDVPRALKFSPNPARLVLDSVGKFYLQGRNTFLNKDKNLPHVRMRRVSVLIMQFFLLMEISEGVEIDEHVKQDAQQGALAWRKRMISEGGVAEAQEEDRLALLFFIACFGVPAGFTNADIRHLLLVGYDKSISDALRRSNALTPKIPEIIEGMLKQNKEFDAANIAYVFGVEDRINALGLLTSFLQKSKESMEIMIGKSESLADVNEAKKMHLSALKSVVECLARCNMDPSELLPGWQFDTKIASLAKDISMSMRFAKERKGDQAGPSRRADSNNTLLEGQAAGHMYDYSMPSSVVHGPPMYETLASHSYAYRPAPYLEGGGSTWWPNTIPGETLASPMYETLASHSYAYRPAPYLKGGGSTRWPNTIPGDAYRAQPYM